MEEMFIPDYDMINENVILGKKVKMAEVWQKF